MSSRHASSTTWQRRPAEQGAAFLSIAARDPEIFSGVDPERLTLAQQAAGAALLEYRARLMANQNTWCVVSVPTAAWAKRVFPEASEDEAVAKLWDAIFRTVRIGGDQDVVAAWHDHIDYLHRAAKFLNINDFASLHYTNELGTDLTIELPEGHLWAGGSEMAATHVPFVANLPTEEVYTLPKRDGVTGRVVASKPLVYQGSLIEHFWLEFEGGKAVRFHAEKGEDVLAELLKTDEGSARLTRMPPAISRLARRIRPASKAARTWTASRCCSMASTTRCCMRTSWSAAANSPSRARAAVTVARFPCSATAIL